MIWRQTVDFKIIFCNSKLFIMQLDYWGEQIVESESKGDRIRPFIKFNTVLFSKTLQAYFFIFLTKMKEGWRFNKKSQSTGKSYLYKESEKD